MSSIKVQVSLQKNERLVSSFCLTRFLLIAGKSHAWRIFVAGYTGKSTEHFILQRFPAVEVLLCRVSNGDERVDANHPSYLTAKVLLLHQDEFHALLQVLGEKPGYGLAVGSNHLGQEVLAHYCLTLLFLFADDLQQD